MPVVGVVAAIGLAAEGRTTFASIAAVRAVTGVKERMIAGAALGAAGAIGAIVQAANINRMSPAYRPPGARRVYWELLLILPAS
jgi:hypothetical protein